MSALAADAADHMDRIYRYQRFIYDATRKPYLLGRDRLLAALAPPEGGSVLEIACGTGRNLIKAARRYPSVGFYGLDVSTAMLATARRAIAARRLTGHVRVAQADATAFDPREILGRERFDRIFVSYALSMIPEWRQAVSHALGLLSEGGSLHLVDFGQQEGLPKWFRRLLFAWLARFDVEPRADLERELRVLAEPARRRLRFERLYRGYAYYAVLAPR